MVSHRLSPMSQETVVVSTALESTDATVSSNDVGLAVRQAIAAIPDPEIPVITIADLGILRDIEIDHDHMTVSITPTYSGCPAMDHIRSDIERIGTEHGFSVTVSLVYSPAWTTDWMSDDARVRLAAFGIAPPVGGSDEPRSDDINCPQCASSDTSQVSRFGSTACKALLVCGTCAEPFDYFKVL